MDVENIKPPLQISQQRLPKQQVGLHMDVENIKPPLQISQKAQLAQRTQIQRQQQQQQAQQDLQQQLQQQHALEAGAGLMLQALASKKVQQAEEAPAPLLPTIQQSSSLAQQAARGLGLLAPPAPAAASSGPGCVRMYR